MQTEILLRHRRNVLVPEGNAQAAPNYVATLLKNISILGFTFTPAVIERLQRLTPEQLGAFYADLVPALRQMVGAHVRYQPRYPNFPQQVMEMSDAQLYLEAILYYLTREVTPVELKARLPLLEREYFTRIDLGSSADLHAIFRQLLAAKGPLSPTDQADLRWFVQWYGDSVVERLPESIPQRENIAVFGAALLAHTNLGIDLLRRYASTATDVLRLAVAFSGGDVSLAANTKFKPIPRPLRRKLLALLEDCGSLTEDLLRHDGAWLRLGERLHPFEFRARYPKTCAAFEVLRNGLPFRSFNAEVEIALAQRDIPAATRVLRQRPGELARRLDHLLRSSGTAWPEVCTQFAAVAGKAAAPLLLQVMNHFQQREAQHPLRVIFPKGEAAKVQALPNHLPALPAGASDRIVEICRQTLIDRFAQLPPLGKVYIDPQLENYFVPFAQRSASKALRTITRGSRVGFGAGNTIRFFLWWKEGIVRDRPTGRVDIDLSAVLFGADWRMLGEVAYYQLKGANYRAYHSGDIVEAPNGACEFIDIEIDSAVAYGGRYVMMAINAFTSQPFCELPECFAGWMLRKEPNSGEIFEPSTVRDRVDLAAKSRIAIPVIVDLVKREMIWADVELACNPAWHSINNVATNTGGIRALGQALSQLVRPTLHDLFELHALARGTLVAERSAADTVFSVDAGITPFDGVRIIAEYL